MYKCKSVLYWMGMTAAAVGLSSFFLANISFASTVQACKKLKESSLVESDREPGKARKIFCTVSPRMGSVGDYVDIKNQYNYIVATGRVIKQGKVATVVVLTKFNREEGSMAGYPAMLRVNENQDYWTAANASF